MTKSDLKTGMIVEMRNGTKYLVMFSPYYEDRELISFYGGSMRLSGYNEDLKFIQSTAFDIVKVYTAGKSIAFLFLKSNGDELQLKLIWERSEAKEMTVKEIEEQLGYKVKIVGDINA